MTVFFYDTKKKKKKKKNSKQQNGTKNDLIERIQTAGAQL